MKSRLEGHGQDGLTLVELMVSVLLAAILSTGLFVMVSGQQQTYTSQANELTSQQNLWGAMEYLSGQVRMAGYGFVDGCPLSRVQLFNPSGVPIVISAITISNNLNLYSGVADGSDSFQVTYRPGGNTGPLGTFATTVATNPPNADFTLASTTGWSVNDWGVVHDPTMTIPCAFFMVTNVQPTTLAHVGINTNNPTSVADWATLTPPIPATGWTANARLTWVGPSLPISMSFAIKRDVDPPQLVMWQGTAKSAYEVIADGIEDLQISAGCDREATTVASYGIVEEGNNAAEMGNDEWTNNAPAGTADPAFICTSPLRAVRLTMVARSASRDLTFKNGMLPPIEDRASVADSTPEQGTYRRTTLSATVQPRNLW